MSLFEILTEGGSWVVLVLVLVQIAPIEINPWTAAAKWIGRALTVDLVEEIKKDRAKTARYRILRFDDEIRLDVHHSEEHFNQIIDDINEYERFCKGHPEFPNRKAVKAIKNILEVYESCKEKKSFLT